MVLPLKKSSSAANVGWAVEPCSNPNNVRTARRFTPSPRRREGPDEGGPAFPHGDARPSSSGPSPLEGEGVRGRRIPNTARGDLSQIKVPNSVVRRRAEPEPALGVARELAHRVLRVRHRELGDLAGCRVEPAEYVHPFGGVPDLVIGIDAERVRRGLLAGQREFLEALGLGIELADLAGLELGEPDEALLVDLDAARETGRGRRLIFGDLERLGVDLADAAITPQFREPDITGLVDGDAVGIGHV